MWSPKTVFDLEDNKIVALASKTMALFLFFSPRNDLYCVRWDVKLYSPTHSVQWVFVHAFHMMYLLKLYVLNICWFITV